MIKIRIAKFLLWYGSILVRASAALAASAERGAKARLRSQGVPGDILESDRWWENPIISDNPDLAIYWPEDPTEN